MFFRKKNTEKRTKEVLLSKSTLFVFGVANDVIRYMCDDRPFTLVHANLIFEESEVKSNVKAKKGTWITTGGAVYQRVCVDTKIMQGNRTSGLSMSFTVRNLQLPFGYYQIVPNTMILVDTDFHIFPKVELIPKDGSFIPKEGDEETIEDIKLMLPGLKPEELVTWEDLPEEK